MGSWFDNISNIPKMYPLKWSNSMDALGFVDDDGNIYFKIEKSFPLQHAFVGASDVSAEELKDEYIAYIKDSYGFNGAAPITVGGAIFQTKSEHVTVNETENSNIYKLEMLLQSQDVKADQELVKYAKEASKGNGSIADTINQVDGKSSDKVFPKYLTVNNIIKRAYNDFERVVIDDAFYKMHDHLTFQPPSNAINLAIESNKGSSITYLKEIATAAINQLEPYDINQLKYITSGADRSVFDTGLGYVVSIGLPRYNPKIAEILQPLKTIELSENFVMEFLPKLDTKGVPDTDCTQAINSIKSQGYIFGMEGVTAKEKKIGEDRADNFGKASDDTMFYLDSGGIRLDKEKSQTDSTTKINPDYIGEDGVWKQYELFKDLHEKFNSPLHQRFCSPSKNIATDSNATDPLLNEQNDKSQII